MRIVCSHMTSVYNATGYNNYNNYSHNYIMDWPLPFVIITDTSSTSKMEYLMHLTLLVCYITLVVSCPKPGDDDKGM